MTQTTLDFNPKRKLNGQNARLLDYLKEHGSITPLISWTECGIYRLSARIYDLRRAGHIISDEIVTVRNRFGEKCHVAKYTLAASGGTPK